jgi:hypothetical protein
MRSWLFALLFVMAFLGPAISQEDKKTDDDKPADPDTGESTIEEKTLGLLPNPLQKYGVKFSLRPISAKSWGMFLAVLNEAPSTKDGSTWRWTSICRS